MDQTRLLETLKENPDDMTAINSLFYLLLRRRILDASSPIPENEFSLLVKAFEQAIINLCDPTHEDNYNQFLKIYKELDSKDVSALTSQFTSICKLAVNEVIDSLFKESISNVISRFMEKVAKEP